MDSSIFKERLNLDALGLKNRRKQHKKNSTELFDWKYMFINEPLYEKDVGATK